MKIGAKQKVIKALIVALFATLLLPINFQSAKAVTTTPVMGIYMDAPFVQGSYANTATTSTIDFESPLVTAGDPYLPCANPTHFTSADLNYNCSIFPADNRTYSASTSNSTPTVGGTPTQFVSSWWPSQSYASYLFTFSHPKKYIGFWWSAGSTGNSVDFYSGSTLVTSLNVDQIVSKIGSAPSAGNYASDSTSIASISGTEYRTKYYFGNPQGYSSLTPTAPSDYAPAEPFVYIHAFAGAGVEFNQVQFNGLGFEMDNLTTSETDVSVSNSLVKVQTLYANGATTYRYTFNSNGGSNTDPLDFVSGDDVTLPAAPTRAGYDFTGWKNSSNVTKNAGELISSANSDDTFTAQWRFIPIATDSEIQIDTADLNSSGEMVEGTSITIGGRATKTGTSTVVPDSSGTYSFSYIDGDGVTTSISNCQSMAMTNGISICEFTVPSGKSPYTLQNNFVTNDADYYLSSSRQSISRTVVKPPSSGGGGGGGAPAPTPIAVPQVLPGFTWNPKNIYENQEITEAQLGAEFSVPGTVTYSIPKGFKPKNGKLTIVVNFKPLDTSQYLEVQITREIDVLKVDALAVEGIVTGEASTQKEIVVPQLKTLGKVYFNTDEFFLDAKDRKYLKEVAKKVKKTGSKSVLILGHTDVKKGVDNEWLSKSRADAVSSFLKLFNIKSTITEAWYGPRKPAVKGLDKLSLAKNRRVEIYLLN